MAPDEIRAAARLFAPGTGLGADGLHPRLIACLSDAALMELDALLRRAERGGTWPLLLCIIHVVFLAKPDGGWRPIS
eukprot:8689273-Lingulodinium_polyedra.AAC.1